MTHKGTVPIETERLTLRRFEPADAGAMFRNWANDPEVAKFLTWQPHGTIEATRGVIENWVNGYEAPNKYEWAIVPKALGEPVGSIAAMSPDDRVRSFGSIGYCIGKAWWHNGYVAEALCAIVKFLFEEIGANRISAIHDPRNPNSGAVMRKAGFTFEAARRQAGFNNQGICDHCEYVFLAEDYFKTASLTFAPYDLARDREFLAAAHAETFALTFHIEIQPDWLNAELAKERDVRDGAYLGGKLVGICDLQRRSIDGFGDCGSVNFFFIAPQYRNRGLGGQLIAHAENWCRVQGLKALFLKTGRTNAPAHKCYENNGFARCPQIDSKDEIGYMKNIMPYAIRAMALADYAECYALWQAAAGADSRADCRQKTIENILRRNPDTCFAATDNGAIVGTAMCEFGGDGAYLSHLAVAETHRRRGIASGLVGHLQKKLKSLDTRKVRILVFSGNETAHKFWESIGFEARDDVVYRDKAI
jgi:ribosomal-protein-alanine N-acetyltransferase